MHATDTFVFGFARTLTAHPHVSGTPEDFDNIGEVIYNQWREFGFDKVELVNYTVLLSYPNRSNPNVLQLRNATNFILYSVNTMVEPPLIPSEDDPTVIPPYNAYSGSGSVMVLCSQLLLTLPASIQPLPPFLSGPSCVRQLRNSG